MDAGPEEILYVKLLINLYKMAPASFFCAMAIMMKRPSFHSLPGIVYDEAHKQEKQT